MTSLYAAEIAINHLVPELTSEDFVTETMDIATNSDMALSDAVHIHAGHDREPFDKWAYHERQVPFKSITSLAALLLHL